LFNSDASHVRVQQKRFLSGDFGLKAGASYGKLNLSRQARRDRETEVTSFFGPLVFLVSIAIGGHVKNSLDESNTVSLADAASGQDLGKSNGLNFGEDDGLHTVRHVVLQVF